MIVKLLTEHHLEFLSLKGGCRGSSESTLVKIPHCWKSHVMAHFISCFTIGLSRIIKGDYSCCVWTKNRIGQNIFVLIAKMIHHPANKCFNDI